MPFPPVLEYAHQLVRKVVDKDDIVIDATLGNGYDTVFLADLMGDEGHVYGFDIQEQAIKNTKNRLIEYHLLHRVTLINDGHENIQQYIPASINGIMFNLGYLPGSSKRITTVPKKTIKALQSVMSLLQTGGIITIIVYIKHDEGIEAKKLEEYIRTIDQKKFSVVKYQFLNQQGDPPYLIGIEKI